MSSTHVNVPPSPLGLGQVFSLTFAVLRRRLGLFVGLAALPVGVTYGLFLLLGIVTFVAAGGLVAGGAPDEAGLMLLLVMSGGGTILTMIVVAVLEVYVQGLMATATRETMEHRYPSFAELRQAGSGYLGRFLPVYLLFNLAVGLLLGLCALPAVAGVGSFFSALASDPRADPEEYVGTVAGGLLLSMLLMMVAYVAIALIRVKLAFMVPVAACEGLGGTAILKRSWGLTRGSFWQTLGYLLVMGLIFGTIKSVLWFVSQVVSDISGIMAQSRDVPTAALLPLLTITSVVMALSLALALIEVPVMTIYITTMYVDRVRCQAMPGYGQPGFPRQAYPPPGYGPQPGQPGPCPQPGPYGPQPGPYPPGHGAQPGYPQPGAGPHSGPSAGPGPLPGA